MEGVNANNKYDIELQVGVRVVQMACCLCQKVQKGSFGPSPDHVISKDDDSPVTVAGKVIYFCRVLFS